MMNEDPRPHAGNITSKKRRQKHTKSRKGCVLCKLRHVKCDEVQPRCTSCRKSDIECRWETASAATRKKGFRKFMSPCYSITSTSPQSTPYDKLADTALEYFCVQTLPILRICQPSILWTHLTSALVQTHEAIRDISIALGFTQRLCAQQISGQQSQETLKGANLSYGRALRSLRMCLASGAAPETSVVQALGSLLMVVLESLRQCPSAMLMHLHSGLQLCSASHHSTLSSRAMHQEILRLLSRYRVSSGLYGLLVTQNIDVTRSIMKCSRVPKQAAIEDGTHEALASRQYEILDGIVQCWQQVDDLFRGSKRPVAPIGEMFLLQIQQSLLQEDMPVFSDSDPNRHLYSFATAQFRLTDLTLKASSEIHSGTIGIPTAADCIFDTALDALEAGLTGLRSLNEASGLSSVPFSMGLGVISSVGLIALGCRNVDIRRRALQILDRCPQREGLWDVNEIRQLCSKDTIVHGSLKQLYYSHP